MTTPKERMSDERFAFVRECIESDLETSILVHGAPDRQFDSFKVNKELLAEIDALRAELTAARTVADGEVAALVARLHAQSHQSDKTSVIDAMLSAADLLTRLSAAKAEAERERDSAREALGELAQIVGETDHDHSNVENEPCPVCCCLIQANHTLAALKPTPTPDR